MKIKNLILASAVMSGCGQSKTDYNAPKNIEIRPFNATFTSLIGGLSYDVLTETINDLEDRMGETFMHAGRLAKTEIKFQYSDLQDGMLGLAEMWPHRCTISMNESMNPSNKLWTKEDLAGVYRHEIGHCFGLMHDEDDPDSIMYPYYSPSIHLKDEAITNFVEKLKKYRHKMD